MLGVGEPETARVSIAILPTCGPLRRLELSRGGCAFCLGTTDCLAQGRVTQDIHLLVYYAANGEPTLPPTPLVLPMMMIALGHRWCQPHLAAKGLLGWHKSRRSLCPWPLAPRIPGMSSGSFTPAPPLCANTGWSKHGDPVFPHFWSFF